MLDGCSGIDRPASSRRERSVPLDGWKPVLRRLPISARGGVHFEVSAQANVSGLKYGSSFL